MKTFKKIISNKYLLSILGIVFFFLLWTAIYFIAGQRQSVFPSPIETIQEAFSYLGDAYIYKCIWGSLERMLIGFGIASILGIIVGVIVGNYTNLKYVFNPTMIALKAIPTAAIVFLFLVMAGLRNAPIYVVAIIVFPMVYEATVSGYNHVPDEILQAARVDSNNRLYTNFKIKFPLSFPYIALGLVSSFALSFKIEIMAEVISGSSSYGLGRAIQSAYINSTTGLVSTFAYAFIAIVVMLIVSLIIAIIKKVTKLNDLIEAK
ncbi:MAG: ABC transporter permease subunit [Bacilli bacterium]|nr:ABC transporter permease subunit [Bacilli bacterium]